MYNFALHIHFTKVYWDVSDNAQIFKMINFNVIYEKIINL